MNIENSLLHLVGVSVSESISIRKSLYDSIDDLIDCSITETIFRLIERPIFNVIRVQAWNSVWNTMIDYEY